MVETDHRPYYVSKIKDLAESIDDSIDDASIVSQLEQYVKSLRRSIEFRHSDIYILIYDVGPDDNFARYYEPVGIMTEHDALEKLKTRDSNGYYKRVQEISKEEWDDFIHLRDLTDIATHIDWLKRYNDFSEAVRDDISLKISKLRQKLGLTYGWEIVV